MILSGVVFLLGCHTPRTAEELAGDYALDEGRLENTQGPVGTPTTAKDGLTGALHLDSFSRFTMQFRSPGDDDDAAGSFYIQSDSIFLRIDGSPQTFKGKLPHRGRLVLFTGDDVHKAFYTYHRLKEK